MGHDGSNICPQEVEDSLLENTAVASAGVVGIMTETEIRLIQTSCFRNTADGETTARRG